MNQSDLKSALDYNPKTGIFTWATSKGDKRIKGTVAGCLDNGYIVIKLNYVKYGAHRLAFLWMTGFMPYNIDHEDRNKSNNKWSNLRAATSSQNHANSGMHSRNTSGVKGVCFHKPSGLWWAYINWEGKRKSLKMHKTIEDAAEAREVAEKKYFGEFQAI